MNGVLSAATVLAVVWIGLWTAILLDVGEINRHLNDWLSMLDPLPSLVDGSDREANVITLPYPFGGCSDSVRAATL